MTGQEYMRNIREVEKEYTFEEWLENRKFYCVCDYGLEKIGEYLCGEGCEQCWKDVLEGEVR